MAVDGSAGVTPATPVPFRRFRVVATFPHNTNAFTEGLLFSGGNLFESTGLRGQSSVRRVDLTTGNVLNQTNRLKAGDKRLPADYPESLPTWQAFDARHKG